MISCLQARICINTRAVLSSLNYVNVSFQRCLLVLSLLDAVDISVLNLWIKSISQLLNLLFSILISKSFENHLPPPPAYLATRFELKQPLIFTYYQYLQIFIVVMLMFNCSDLFTYPRPFCGYHVICSVGMELLFKSFSYPLPQLRLKSITYLASKASDKRLWPCSLMSLGLNSLLYSGKVGGENSLYQRVK